MTGVGLFVCVVGPGFDSTSPAFVRSTASQAAGSDGRLTQKTESGPISGGRDCVDTNCADVCSSPTSCRLCLLDRRRLVISMLLWFSFRNAWKEWRDSTFQIFTELLVPPQALVLHQTLYHNAASRVVRCVPRLALIPS